MRRAIGYAVAGVLVWWSDEATDHMFTRHGVTPEETTEVLEDLDALWYDPDPTSKSGRSVRVVGWCYSRSQVVTVILLHGRSTWEWHGVNGWVAKAGRDRRKYREQKGGAS